MQNYLLLYKYSLEHRHEALMSFVTHVDVPGLVSDTGIPLNMMEAPALLLMIDGIETTVKVSDLDDLDTDAEDFYEASTLYVSYKGFDYQFDLTSLTDEELEEVKELFDPQ